MDRRSGEGPRSSTYRHETSSKMFRLLTHNTTIPTHSTTDTTVPALSMYRPIRRMPLSYRAPKTRAPCRNQRSMPQRRLFF